MTTPITNMDDTIDSRDVTARIEELGEKFQSLDSVVAEANSVYIDAYQDAGEETPIVLELSDMLAAARMALREWDNSDAAKELASLKALATEAEGAPDWRHGATLIRDSYFKEYAMELADDIGAIPNDAAWPMTCIDWDLAARELRMDYTAIEFGDVTYWIR